MAVYSAMHGLLSILVFILLSLVGNSDSATPKGSLFRFPPTRKWMDSAVRVPASSQGAKYHVRNFTQILDHYTFVPESYQTFQQRYLINSEHWGGASTKSPIFVYTGNEGFIETFAQNTGFMFDIAPQFKHRFYGHSMPFGSQRAAYSNSSTLGFLSSAQALTDFGKLITDLKKNLSAEESPVVVFGGSYGGMLAAWFRLKYPHIAIGAVASSAPILDFDNITSPTSFDNTVSEDFRSESENCFQVIKGSWNVIDNMTSTPKGLKSLRKALRICESNSDNDIAENLGHWFHSPYIYAAMTDYPVAANFIQPLPAYPVKQMCKAIDNPSGSTDLLNRLYRGAVLALIYDRVILMGMLAGDFEVCTETVMPMADDPKTSMFPSSTYDYEVFADTCESAHGVQPRPHTTL